MKLAKSTLQFSISTAFGIAMLPSCLDDSPRGVDAATCNCPASEAPIAGRTIVSESAPLTIPAGGRLSVGLACDRGMQFLSGSCTAADPTTLEDIALTQFGFDPKSSGWGCSFKNNKLAAVQVKASVLCLKPAT